MTQSRACLLNPVLHAAHSVPMNNFAGLMVPRRAHAAELSHVERVLAWAPPIESDHIPLRTRQTEVDLPFLFPAPGDRQ